MTEASDDGLMEELRRLWVAATAETIVRDIEHARKLAANASRSRRSEADAFVGALQRLERWLRDF